MARTALVRHCFWMGTDHVSLDMDDYFDVSAAYPQELPATDDLPHRAQVPAQRESVAVSAAPQSATGKPFGYLRRGDRVLALHQHP